MALSGWRLRTQNIHLRQCWYHALEAPASLGIFPWAWASDVTDVVSYTFNHRRFSFTINIKPGCLPPLRHSRKEWFKDCPSNSLSLAFRKSVSWAYVTCAVETTHGVAILGWENSLFYDCRCTRTAIKKIRNSAMALMNSILNKHYGEVEQSSLQILSWTHLSNTMFIQYQDFLVNP